MNSLHTIMLAGFFVDGAHYEPAARQAMPPSQSERYPSDHSYR